MQKTLFALLTCWSAACPAAGPPVFGLYVDLPVTSDGPRVIARPAYILTNEKLAAPAVFSGLMDRERSIDVLCCFQVSDARPLTLAGELAKYGRDSFFVEHMKAVKGYRYIYAAQRSANRKQWSPYMQVLVNNAANPEDSSPYTVPVIAATFAAPKFPSPFTVGSTRIKLDSRYDKAWRAHYVFTAGGRTIAFSEPVYPED